MISVCMATFNGERFILEQLRSVLTQLGSQDEVVISDDGSQDATLDLVRSLGDARIRVIEHRGNHGYTPNFENALRACRGEYVFLCDQDDVWHPDKLRLCLQALEQSDCVFHDAVVTDGSLREQHASFWALRGTGFSLPSTLISFRHLGCCMAFRRAVLCRALPFPRNHRLCTHDNWLALVAFVFFRVSFLHVPLLSYRRHGGNTSLFDAGHTHSLRFKLGYRVYLLWHLLLRSFCRA